MLRTVARFSAAWPFLALASSSEGRCRAPSSPLFSICQCARIDARGLWAARSGCAERKQRRWTEVSLPEGRAVGFDAGEALHARPVFDSGSQSSSLDVQTFRTSSRSWAWVDSLVESCWMPSKSVSVTPSSKKP